ncbi:MAG: hypothetical protein WD009_13710 [Phycisphaeraceae bacterium]
MANVIVSTLLVSLLAFLMLSLLVRLIWRLRRNLRSGRRADEPALACRCGYNLAGLDMPRCPECGRVIGFDKTFQELGVDEREVMRHMAERRQQKQRDA